MPSQTSTVYTEGGRWLDGANQGHNPAIPPHSLCGMIRLGQVDPLVFTPQPRVSHRVMLTDRPDAGHAEHEATVAYIVGYVTTVGDIMLSRHNFVTHF